MATPTDPRRAAAAWIGEHAILIALTECSVTQAVLDPAQHLAPGAVFAVERLGSGDLRLRALRCDGSGLEVTVDTAGHLVRRTVDGGRFVDSSEILLGRRSDLPGSECPECGEQDLYDERTCDPVGHLARRLLTVCRACGWKSGSKR